MGSKKSLRLNLIYVITGFFILLILFWVLLTTLFHISDDLSEIREHFTENRSEFYTPIEMNFGPGPEDE